MNEQDIKLKYDDEKYLYDCKKKGIDFPFPCEICSGVIKHYSTCKIKNPISIMKKEDVEFGAVVITSDGEEAIILSCLGNNVTVAIKLIDSEWYIFGYRLKVFNRNELRIA